MADDSSYSDYAKSMMGKLKGAFAPASARADANIADRHTDPNYNSSGLSDDMKLSADERIKKFKKGFLGSSDNSN